MFGTLRELLSQATRELREANVRAAAIERHLEGMITAQQATIEWLRTNLTAVHVAHATLDSQNHQLQIRLSQTATDFEWARTRINVLEQERATLLARILTPTMNVALGAPEIAPILRTGGGNPTIHQMTPPGVGSGTPLSDMAIAQQAAEMIHGLFHDPLEDVDGSAPE